MTDDAPLTLKSLIRALSARYTLAGEPVHVSTWDSGGDLIDCVVTGISVRTGRDGKLVQSLKMRPVEGNEAS